MGNLINEGEYLYMTVKEAAGIFMALAKLSKSFDLAFNDALNIVKLKNQLQNYFEIVINKEKYVLDTYGKRNDKGDIETTEDGSPIFVNTEDSKKALIGLQELYNQRVEGEISKIKVAMPDKKGDMTLSEIEALMEVIDFE